MKSLTDTYKLLNGYEIPCIGFGTWQSPNGEEPDLPAMEKAVEAAIKAGYRHIDTAADYGNEIAVGKGIKNSGIPRNEIFVTSKLWNDERGYETTKAAFEKTLADLGLEYIDMYLIHWPAAPHQFENWQEINNETWRAIDGIEFCGGMAFDPDEVDF